LVYPFLLKGKPCPVSVPSPEAGWGGKKEEDQVRDLIENTFLLLFPPKTGSRGKRDK